jgi:NAD(P)-dependent dehydrogenase (short-subunit alcohol dehydrogenase family)
MERVALVTGASRGLGRVVARVLASRGFDLALGARHREGLDAIAWELRASGVRVETRAGDVADDAVRRGLVDAAASLGGLDVIVNNASELGGLSPLVEADPGRLERIFRVNAIAPIALVRYALPLLSIRGGLVVNVSSDAAIGGYPGWGVYGASKAALDLAGKTLAAELTDLHIGVVTVDPGDLRTRMHQEAFPGEDISDRPLPEVTAPFWEWLLDRDPGAETGKRLRAQEEGEPWALRV